MHINYKKFEKEMIEIRRTLHQIPELGFEEFETQKFIINYLEKLGLKPKAIAKTGVVCMIHGKLEKPVIMLRSDIDALPIEEETGLEFKSKNKGRMHACGHDAHMAMLLTIAKILTDNKDKLNGSIKLAFQPNEEDAGAYLMVEEGILENPKVDRVLGTHIWSPIGSGKVGILSGPLMASSYYYKVSITGKGGHGGAPHQAINPIDVAVDMINEMRYIQSQALDVTKPTVMTVCKFNAGTSSPIIIPETASFEGSIRCLYAQGHETRETIKRKLENIAKNRNAEITVEFEYGNEVLINDSDTTSFLREAAKEVVGNENILSEGIAVMLGDDFSDFSNKVPGCYYFLGTGNKAKGTDYPHHHSKFNIDEDVMIKGVEIMIKAVNKIMR